MSEDKITLEMLCKEENFTIERFTSWLKSEHLFWKTIYPKFEEYGQSEINKPLLNYIAEINTILMVGINQATDAKLAQRLLRRAHANFAPTHTHPVAKELLDAAADEEKIETIVVCYKICQSALNETYVASYQSDYKNLIEETRKEFEELKEHHKEIQHNLIEKLSQASAGLDRQFISLSGSAAEKIRVEAELRGQEINEIATTARQNVTANDSVKFWDTKKDIHGKRARLFGLFSLSLGVIAILTLSALIFAGYKDYDTTVFLNFKLPNHFYITVAILVASAFAWALRILLQIMTNNLSLEAEALERSTAIKTYVALSTQKIDESISLEFHRALLSFGQIKLAEDSTIPDLIKVLEKFFPKKD